MSNAVRSLVITALIAMIVAATANTAGADFIAGMTCEERREAMQSRFETKCAAPFPTLTVTSDCKAVCKSQSMPDCVKQCGDCKSLRENIDKGCGRGI